MDGTLITVGNAGEEPVDALITLYSAAGVELYEMEAALPPQEQAWVDVGRLIRQQVPDKEGRVLPADITSGSYAFRERERKAIGSLYEGKVVIDKTYGSVTYGCGYGCCIQLAYLIPSPYVFPAGWGFVGVEGQSGCGSTDLTSWTWDWMTGHTNIALAHGFGSMEGLSPGSTWTGAWVYTEVEDWVSGGCYPVATYVDGEVQVKPTISGPNTVWWFDGLSPSGYATEITLFSNAGPSTQWEVASGANKVTLSATSGTSVNVTSSGTAWSGGTGNDVQIVAKLGGMPSAPHFITTRKPHQLVPTTTGTECDGDYGYFSVIRYDVWDQLEQPLPYDVDYNEKWTTGYDNVIQNNWKLMFGDPPNVFPGTTLGPGLVDLVSGPLRQFNPAPSPDPACPGDTTLVHRLGQEWRIGTHASGVGARVQTNTLNRYLDHASHTARTSPAP